MANVNPLGLLYVFVLEKERKKENRKEGREGGRNTKRGVSLTSHGFTPRDLGEDRLEGPSSSSGFSPHRVCPCSLSLKGSGTRKLWTWMEQQPPSRSLWVTMRFCSLLGVVGYVPWACLKNTTEAPGPSYGWAPSRDVLAESICPCSAITS